MRQSDLITQTLILSGPERFHLPHSSGLAVHRALHLRWVCTVGDWSRLECKLATSVVQSHPANPSLSQRCLGGGGPMLPNTSHVKVKLELGLYCRLPAHLLMSNLLLNLV